jgi:RNA polymerase sigma-70 factor (ECF subfamily)
MRRILVGPGEPRHRLLFERLYIEHFAFVRRTVQAYGVCSRDAGDLTQEVFVRAYEHIASYDEARPAHLWLYGFAIRLASDYHSRGYVRHEVLQEPLPDKAREELSAEELLAAHELCESIFQAIEHLPPDLRAVLVLHDIEGRIIPEIARELGIPVNTGYSKLRRARERVRRHGVRSASAITAGLGRQTEG